MIDKELLELAAKAMGLRIRDEFAYDEEWGVKVSKDGESFYWWNPLKNKGDAFEVAAVLGISITPYPVYNEKGRHSVVTKRRVSADLRREQNSTEVLELYGDNVVFAWCRAITRSAAEIARLEHEMRD